MPISCVLSLFIKRFLNKKTHFHKLTLVTYNPLQLVINQSNHFCYQLGCVNGLNAGSGGLQLMVSMLNAITATTTPAQMVTSLTMLLDSIRQGIAPCVRLKTTIAKPIV